MRRVIDEISRIFVGVLFVFSGLIKVNDPYGTAIKLEEYFDVFATDFFPFFHYLVPFALTFSVIFSVMEVILGIALLMNFRMRMISWALLLLILFFSFLTFYSAQFNKVTDCGCFGDAIHFTPWQSFGKDIILLVFILYILFRHKHFKEIFPGRNGDLLMTGATIILIIIAIYSISHLPYVDFRSYKVGTDIAKAMQPSEPLRYNYTMEKDGQQIVMDEYPEDTTYKFVKMNLINPEAQPEITDFNIWNDDGDFTQQVFEGTKLLILLPDVNRARLKHLNEVLALAKAEEDNLDVWVITSNDGTTYEAFRHEHQIPYIYFFADGTVAKAMIRANPGLILLNSGSVLGKWHNNDVPDKDVIDLLIGK